MVLYPADTKSAPISRRSNPDQDEMRERWMGSIPPEFRPHRITEKVPRLVQCMDCGKGFEKRSTARRCKPCQSRVSRYQYSGRD
jgi:hypothetical protein